MVNIEKPTWGLDINNISPIENIIITNERSETTDSYKELMLIKDSELSNLDLDKFRYIVTFLEKNYPNYTTTNPKIGYLVGFILDKIISSKDARSSARREYIEKNLPEIAAKISSLRVEVWNGIDKRKTVEYNESETIEQTNNIKNFLKKSILSPEAFLDTKEIDLPAIIALAQKIGRKKDLSLEEKRFIWQIYELNKSYQASANNYILRTDEQQTKNDKKKIKDQIEAQFKKVETIPYMAVISACWGMQVVVDKKEEYKRKSFGDLVNELWKFKTADNMTPEDKKEKSILIPALADKMKESWIYLKPDKNWSLKVAKFNVPWKSTSDYEKINTLSQDDLQILTFYISMNNDVKNLDTSKNIWNNVLDQVVKKYNFTDKEWRPWNVQRDFIYKDWSINTPSIANANIAEFTKQADDKIAELQKENQEPWQSEELIKNNIAEIEKLELAKIEAKNKDIFSNNALKFLNEALRSNEWVTAAAWIPSKWKWSLEDILKGIENWKPLDALIGALPWLIAWWIIYALLNWLTKWTKMNGLVDTYMYALGWAFGIKALADSWIKASEFTPKPDLNWTNEPDRKTMVDDIKQSLDDWTTVPPDWLDSKFKTTYTKLKSLNSQKEQANFDQSKFDKIFIVLSSDPKFLETNISNFDINNENELYSRLSKSSQWLLQKYNISSRDLLIFCRMLNNPTIKDWWDIKFMDVFVWQEKINENYNSYFPWETEFNKDIDLIVKKLPWLPIDAKDFWTPEEIKRTSLRAQVQEAIDPKYFTGSWDIRDMWNSLTTLNTFDELRLNIIKTINKDLSNIQKPTDKEEEKLLNNIKSKYASLERKHQLLYEVDKLVFDWGYWHIASILWTGWLIFWDLARNIPINQAKTNSDQVIELNRIIDDIDKLNLNAELTKLVTEWVMTEEDKTSVLREVMKMKERVNENQEASLLFLVNSPENKDKSVTEWQLKLFYINKMKNPEWREKLKKEVQDIVNRLVLWTPNIQDTLSFRKALWEYWFTSDIKNDEIKKLKIIMNITKDGKNDEIITLATQWISENFAKFKKDLLDYGTSKKAEIDTIKSNIATITDVSKLKEEKDKLDAIREDFFIWDNSITATAIYWVESAIDWIWLWDWKSKKYYDFFKTMEKRVQEIEPTFNIPDTNYPSETVLTDAYRKIWEKAKNIPYLIQAKADQITFTNDTTMDNYIEQLKKDKKTINDYESLVNDLTGWEGKIGTLNSWLENEKRNFMEQLKIYLSGINSYDKLKDAEFIYTRFNKIGWSEIFGLFWEDKWIKEILYKKALKLKIEQIKNKTISELENWRIKDTCIEIINLFKWSTKERYFKDYIKLNDFKSNLESMKNHPVWLNKEQTSSINSALEKLNWNITWNINFYLSDIWITWDWWEKWFNLDIPYLWRSSPMSTSPVDNGME